MNKSILAFALFLILICSAEAIFNNQLGEPTWWTNTNYGQGIYISSASNRVVNSNNQYYCWRKTSEATGDIKTIVINLGSRTGTAGTYEVGVVSDSSGNPSGTWIAMSNFTGAMSTAELIYTPNWTDGVGLGVGQIYHFCYVCLSGCDGSNNIGVSAGGISAGYLISGTQRNDTSLLEEFGSVWNVPNTTRQESSPFLLNVSGTWEGEGFESEVIDDNNGSNIQGRYFRIQTGDFNVTTITVALKKDTQNQVGSTVVQIRNMSNKIIANCSYPPQTANVVVSCAIPDGAVLTNSSMYQLICNSPNDNGTSNFICRGATSTSFTYANYVNAESRIFFDKPFGSYFTSPDNGTTITNRSKEMFFNLTGTIVSGSPPPDTTSPANITNLGAPSLNNQSILINWTNPADSDFNHTELWANGIFIVNISQPTATYNITGRTNNTLYSIVVRPVDHLNNIGLNTTIINTTAQNLVIIIPNINNSLALFIPFNETSGTVAASYGTLSSRNMTLQPNATFANVSGKYRLKLNGTQNSFASLTDFSGLNWTDQQDISACLVIKSNTANYPAEGAIFGITKPGVNAFTMAWRNPGKLSGVYSNTIWLDGNVTLFPDVFYHVCMTHSSSSNTVRFYVNGVSAGTSVISENGNGSIQAFQAGAYSSTTKFNGSINHLRYWPGYALTGAEVILINNTDFTEGSNIAPLTPSLNSPANNSAQNDTFTATFSYTALDNNIYDTLSCQLRINDMVNRSNSSLANGSTVTNQVIFPNMNQTLNWSVNCSDGASSALSGTRYLTINDLAPSQAAGLSYSATETSIMLSWTANPESDISSYNIFRSADISGPFSFLNSTSSTNYGDGGLVMGTDYFYKITAQDQAGTNGSFSSILPARTVGTGSTAGGGDTGGGGGGGGAGSENKSIVECGLYIKIPKGRVTILQSSSVDEVHENVPFEICNTNNVAIVHHFDFQGGLTSYCTISELTKILAGNSCYTGSYSCRTPAEIIQDRLIIKRELYGDLTQEILQCESNILVTVGRLSWIDLGQARLGTYFWPVVVFIAALIVLVLILGVSILQDFLK